MAVPVRFRPRVPFYKRPMTARIFRRIAESHDLGQLDENEFLEKLHRVGGDIICPICSFSYADHPNETRMLDHGGYPWAKRLCDGTWGKT